MNNSNDLKPPMCRCGGFPSLEDSELCSFCDDYAKVFKEETVRYRQRTKILDRPSQPTRFFSFATRVYVYARLNPVKMSLLSLLLIPAVFLILICLLFPS